MSAFDRELSDLAERLRLPQPVRSRVLLELAADLEDLERFFEVEGASAEEAHRRAVETLVPMAAALEELEGLHRPLYQRLVDRFSDRARHRLERGLLFLFVGGLCALALTWLARGDLLTDPSFFLWPLLALGLATAAVATWKGFGLFVKREHGADRLRRGLWVLPVTAVAAIMIGLGGAAFDFHALAGRLEGDISNQEVELLRWLRQDMAMLSIGLLVSSLSGALWLLISAGLATVEQSEAELLTRISPAPRTLRMEEENE